MNLSTLNPLHRIDNLLNKITMYRLVTYGVGAIFAIGVLFSAIGTLSLSTKGLLISFAILMVFGYATNQLLGKLYKVPLNFESGLITSLILCCILPPATTKARMIGAAVAVIIAMSVKFVLAIRRHHFVNPAASGAVVVALAGITYATWWVGSPPMLPFTLLLGFLVVRKIHRIQMFAVFTLAAAGMLLLVGLSQGSEATTLIKTLFTSYPLIFLGTIMLTEPSTMPSTLQNQMLYGFMVGALFTSQLHFGKYGSTPENVLILGNIITYLMQPRRKVRLKLKAKHQMSQHIYDYEFEPDAKLNFNAGQYLEWTMKLPKIDGRGNRRSFTIASSPTEPNIHLGVKFYDPSSSFKQTLLAMKPGDELLADQLAGDFTMPDDPKQKLVFVAGGIGVTPFRSMIQYLIDTKDQRDVVLIYSAAVEEEIVYRDLIKQAEAELNFQAYYVIGNGPLPAGGKGFQGRLTPEQLVQAVPDFKDRMFYLSGPNAMVQGLKTMLLKAGVVRRRLRTDYFSGY